MTEKVGVRAKASELSFVEGADAANALVKLHAAGFKEPGQLTKIAEDYIRRHPQATKTSVESFHDLWLALKTKRGRRKVSIRSARSNFKPFLMACGGKSLTDVTLADVEKVVYDEEIEARSQINRAGAITNFFNEAKARKLIGNTDSDHPCAGLVLPSVEDPTPDPYSVSEAQALLNFAWETEDEFHCTAFIAIGLFTGLRTEEMLRSRFVLKGIDMEKGLITVAASQAKKRTARILEMPENLRTILHQLSQRPRVTKKHCSAKLQRPTDLGSRVVSPKLLQRFKRTLAKKTGIKWHRNGLRSSFGSYEYERSGDLDRTIAKMGHTGDKETFLNHYRGLVIPGEGAKYFALTINAVNGSGAELASAGTLKE